MNIKLIKYPKLYKKVLDHEIAHLKGDKHKDFKERMGFNMWLFIITHPSSWCQFLPLWYMDNTLIYNRSMGLLWIMGLITGLFIFIGYLNPNITLMLAVALPFIAILLLKLIFNGKS